MGTLYPTERERRAIQKSADQGDESARDYLDLLNACTQVLEGSNGISLARAFVGERDDVYGQSVDDALSELMPVVFRISAGGWEGLKFYVPEEMQQAAQESMDRLKQAMAHTEALKWLKMALVDDNERIEELQSALSSLEDPPSRKAIDALALQIYEELRDSTTLPEMSPDVKRAFAAYLESWDRTVATSVLDQDNTEERDDEATSAVVAAWKTLRQRLVGTRDDGAEKQKRLEVYAHDEALKHLEIAFYNEALDAMYEEKELDVDIERSEFDTLAPKLYQALKDNTQLPEMDPAVKHAFAAYLEEHNDELRASELVSVRESVETDERSFEEDSDELTEEAEEVIEENVLAIIDAWQALRQRLA